MGNIPFEPGTNSLGGDMSPSIEVAGELHCTDTAGLVVRVIRHASPKDAVNFTAQELGLTNGKNDLRVFVDRSVVEVFANNRRCASRILSGTGDVEPQIILANGTAEVRDAVRWEMQTIW